MGSGHKKREYKFTEKTQSKKAVLALILSVLSIAAFVYAVLNSFQHAGAGSIYLGSVGVLSMVLSLASFALAAAGLREENSFKFVPGIALICSFLAAGVWIVIYAVGFFGISL